MRPIDADALVASLEQSCEELRELCDSLKEGEGAKEVYQGELITFLEAILRTRGMPTLDYVPCQQWISTDDEHPKPTQIVLLAYSDKQFIDIGYLDYEDMRWYRLDDSRIARPTHWMPLPEPPKEDER